MSESAPPILRLTLQMLDAQSLEELARHCCRGILELFGAQRAIVRDEDGRIWAEAHVASDPAEPPVPLRLMLNPSPRTELEIDLCAGPDLAVVRGQLLDLVAVARRAWRDRSLLSAEQRRAREDSLTGLENRRSIDEYLGRAFETAIATGVDLTIMAVDLDHFKQVNDDRGHAAGDEVLRLAAESLRRHLRAGDRACRYGGDEFVVALPGLAAGPAASVADRLRQAFAAEAASYGVTMTIGIADLSALGPGQHSGDALVAMADVALYEAKRAGRDCVRQARPLARSVEAG